jgi:hypothetical protein
MAIIALPQGICVCHFLHASPAQEIHCCEHTPTNAKQAPAPTDSEDHGDCCCKQREVLASNASSVSSQPDNVPSLDHVVSADLTSDANSTTSFVLSHASKSAADSIPQILCALRI